LKEIQPQTYIKYTYTNGVKTKIYNPKQVLHIPAFTFDGVLGVSPITYSREAMGLALATEEFGARFLVTVQDPVVF
jgi:phage portal protein BeeE